MTDPPERTELSRLRPASLALLLIPAAFLGYLSGFPFGFGWVVVVAAVALSAGLRLTPRRALGSYAPVPVLAALVLEASVAPLGFGTELFAGLAGLAFLLWLADDPARPSGGALRVLPSLALPALAVGVAWTSALFLPSGSVPLGLAGVLLAIALAGVAVLVGFPSLFDREEART